MCIWRGILNQWPVALKNPVGLKKNLPRGPACLNCDEWRYFDRFICVLFNNNIPRYTILGMNEWVYSCGLSVGLLVRLLWVLVHAVCHWRRHFFFLMKQREKRWSISSAGGEKNSSSVSRKCFETCQECGNRATPVSADRSAALRINSAAHTESSQGCFSCYGHPSALQQTMCHFTHYCFCLVWGGRVGLFYRMYSYSILKQGRRRLSSADSCGVLISWKLMSDWSSIKASSIRSSCCVR